MAEKTQCKLSIDILLGPGLKQLYYTSPLFNETNITKQDPKEVDHR